jgi:hypothetical protein
MFFSRAYPAPVRFRPADEDHHGDFSDRDASTAIEL